MVGIYSRVRTYSCSGKKIFHLESFFSRNSIVNSHSRIPLHLLFVLRGRFWHLLLPFTIKRSYQLDVARDSWAFQTEWMLPLDSEEASVWKSFQVWEFPDRAILEGTKFKSLKQLFVRNFNEEISFLALISVPLILSEDIVSWHF